MPMQPRRRVTAISGWDAPRTCEAELVDDVRTVRDDCGYIHDAAPGYQIVYDEDYEGQIGIWSPEGFAANFREAGADE